MRKIVLVLIGIGFGATVLADGASGSGNGFSGGGSAAGLGSSSGLSDASGLGGSGLSSGISGGNTVVPAISASGGDMNSSAQLNLNNQVIYGANGQALNSGDMYRNANSQSLAGSDQYRAANGGMIGNNQNNLWQNYANMNGGMYTQGGSGNATYVPSVLGNGYVLNPLIQQQDPFQKNVQIRSGLFLAMFGYNLFNLPNSFAPINNTPVDSNYTLGPGDQVNLQAWGSMNVNFTMAVEKDGTIFIPKIGKVSVVGIKAASLDGYLKAKVGRLYRNFTLSATVSQVRSIAVDVAGYALRPGTYQLSALSTLSNAIFAIGGPSMIGSLRHIQVKRAGQVLADFDMYAVLLNGDKSQDVRLLPGDTIYFAPKGKQVAIYDGIKSPAIYEACEYETVNDIVKFAGGFNYNVARNKVVIETLRNNKGLVVNDYPFNLGLQRSVQDGDVIHFFSLNNVYESSIVLMGNVAQPSRYGYKAGMRIKDVIPNKEMLLTKSFWNSSAYNSAGRDNLLTQIGREKATEQVDADNTAMYSTGLNTANANENKKVFGVGDNLFTAGPIQIPEANINWNYASIIRMNNDTYTMNVIPFNLRKALAGDESNNLRLQAGDVIDILSSKDVRTSSATSTIYVFIDGEVNAPGVYEMQPGQSILDAIKAADGLSTKAYLYGTQLSRESVKKKQQIIMNQMLDQLQQTLLGQVSNSSFAGGAQQAANQAQVLTQQQAFIAQMRQVKPTGRVVLGVGSSDVTLEQMPAIAVENGDTIYIPTLPSTVDVIGQVYNPASFMYKPHTTVRQYIDMSGTENQFADTSQEYVLRADGTLYSNQQAGWYGGFGRRNLNPGDAIIVPQKIQFGGLMQGVLNWTQVLANFGTAAAAIQVFK